jgi:hypothetical protein
MIKKGDIVYIKDEYQDEGDHRYIWMAVCDEVDGQVKISPINIGMTLKPICLLKSKWVRKKSANKKISYNL